MMSLSKRRKGWQPATTTAVGIGAMALLAVAACASTASYDASATTETETDAAPTTMLAPLPSSAEPLTRIAFGSCSDQNRPQPIWPVIADAEPDIFLLIGDAIYADTLDAQKMRDDWRQFAEMPEYDRFRRRVPILATWDDHDYGWNDAGSEYALKEQSKQMFLDFFGVAPDHASRQRDGIFAVHRFGPPERRVQIILLDGRTFRDPLDLDPVPYRRYRPTQDTSRTYLGAEQWRWLEGVLQEPARLRLIVSGVQVLGYAAGFESWMTMPHEFERLMELIRRHRVDGVVFLSGDAHFAQLKRGDGGVGYPLYDLTASGLTHSRPASAERPAPLALYPPFGGINFGVVDIEWVDDPRLTLSARDDQGEVVFQHVIPLSELRAANEHVD